MKAAVLKQPGDPNQFVLEERPIPEPTGEQILVRIKAFGLNRSELMTRKGLSPNVIFPRVLGIECVGEVVSDPAGSYVTGQRIAACMGGMGREYDGSYSEYAVLPRNIVIPFESNLSWEILGAIPEMFQTVFGSLHMALKIKRGHTLLNRGGTSSIGLLAAQIAKSMGLNVIATTRSSKNIRVLEENGANKVLIDNGTIAKDLIALYPNKIDYVLELVGAGTLRDSLACVRIGGSVCMSGMLAEQWSIPDFSPMDFIPSAVNLTIYDSGQVIIEREKLQNFLFDVENGHIKLKISQTFRLDDIAKAHTLMENNAACGKLVVINDEVF